MRTLLALLLLALPVQAEVTIQETLAICKAAGIQPAGPPRQSPLKQECSLIGMAYLNYVHQNDLENPYFRECMVMMDAQVPSGLENPYVELFRPGMGESTLKILPDLQLCFDYAIDRTQPREDRVAVSVATIRATLKR